MERWDLVFAGLYLDALDAHLSKEGGPSRPWRLAFDAAPDLPPLLNVLLGVNAHINYDLPQALLAAITDAEFSDPLLLAHAASGPRRIDAILSGRVVAENVQISADLAVGHWPCDHPDQAGVPHPCGGRVCGLPMYSARGYVGCC